MLLSLNFSPLNDPEGINIEAEYRGSRSKHYAAWSLQSCPTLRDPMDCSPLQAPLSMGFSRQYWSGLSFPPPGDLPDPGIKPVSPESPTLPDGFFTTSTTWET